MQVASAIVLLHSWLPAAALQLPGLHCLRDGAHCRGQAYSGVGSDPHAPVRKWKSRTRAGVSL